MGFAKTKATVGKKSKSIKLVSVEPSNSGMTRKIRHANHNKNKASSIDLECLAFTPKVCLKMPNSQSTSYI